MCTFTHVAQIDIKMLIISYVLLLCTFSKAIGEERNSKNDIIYRQTQTDSDTYRDKKTQTKTDLEMGTHKNRHTRTHGLKPRQNHTHAYYVTNRLGQRQTQKITDMFVWIYTERNKHSIIKVRIAVHKQRGLLWQYGVKIILSNVSTITWSILWISTLMNS